MGKRSNFERKPRDFYPTPAEALNPLLPFLHEKTTFVEPCAGDGQLVSLLSASGHICKYASDIEPKSKYIIEEDALDFDPFFYFDYIITNPPWDRKILHPMIDHFMEIAPTWLLFDADWMHTKQSAEFMPYCEKIVSVGRVKWIPDSKMTGKDNCAWYLFKNHKTTTTFFGRNYD